MYFWRNQFNIQINVSMIKQRILDVYHQRWCSSLNNSPRLETYCLFKHECKLESYLDFIQEAKFRISLT
jgi:hypothetical protein